MDSCSAASSQSQLLDPVSVQVPLQDQVIITLNDAHDSSSDELELRFQPAAALNEQDGPGSVEVCPVCIRVRERVGEDDTAGTRTQVQSLNPLTEELELVNFTGRLVVAPRTKRITNIRDATVYSASRENSMSSGALISMASTSNFDPVTTDPDMAGLNLTDYQARKSSSSTEELDEIVSTTISKDTNASLAQLKENSALDTDGVESANVGMTNCVEGIGKVGPGSPLHVLCASPHTNLSELRACLALNPDSPFLRNDSGQTPLHVLTENILLWDSPESSGNQGDAHAFALDLVNINPAAAASTDCQNDWPCRSLLQQWTNYREQGQAEDSKGASLSNFVRRGMGTVITMATSTSLATMSSSRIDSTTTRRSSPKFRKFECTHLTFALQAALAVLSQAITSITLADAIDETHSVALQQSICASIATDVPKLLPKLLLLEPEQDRHRIFNLPLIRRLLLEPLTTGRWLVSMVRHKGLVSRRRAVDYLLLLSNASIHHFYPGGSALAELDDTDQVTELGRAFRESESQVLHALGDMGGELIISLAVLEDKEVYRATSGSALWHILHQGLMRPFVIGIVLIDFVLHVTLMLSFRADVMISGGDAFLSAVPSVVVTAITVFFVARKVTVGMALWSISRSVFKAHILDFWNLFDLVSITLVLVINTVNLGGAFTNPGMNAFVLALLWLKVLSFLRAVNMQMATFILSLMQIVRSIRSFLVVLVVFIMMFGDIMIIIFTTTTNPDLCSGDSEAQQDFCSGTLADSYIRMYGLLIGDFDINDYRGNSSTTAVFLAFTILGVIILLNVLIAIVSDSYEKSKVGAKGLFGMARIGFLTEHLALEQFLQPGQNPLASLNEEGMLLDPHRCASIIGRILRWVVLLGMLSTVLFAETFLFGQAIASVLQDNSNVVLMTVLICMSTVLTVALWTVFHFLFSSAVYSFSFLSTIAYIIGCIDIVMNRLVNLIRRIAFGDLSVANGEDCGEKDEWTERVDHLEAVILAAICESEQKIALRVKAAEDNVKAHELTLTEVL